jgi:hypothetical protein
LKNPGDIKSLTEGATSKGMTQTRSVQLPEDLCAAAEKKFAPQFATIEAMLTFTLQQLLSGRAEQADAEEQRLIEQRLRDLGYL